MEKTGAARPARPATPWAGVQLLESEPRWGGGGRCGRYSSGVNCPSPFLSSLSRDLGALAISSAVRTPSPFVSSAAKMGGMGRCRWAPRCLPPPLSSPGGGGGWSPLGAPAWPPSGPPGGGPGGGPKSILQSDLSAAASGERRKSFGSVGDFVGGNDAIVVGVQRLNDGRRAMVSAALSAAGRTIGRAAVIAGGRSLLSGRRPVVLRGCAPRGQTQCERHCQEVFYFHISFCFAGSVHCVVCDAIQRSEDIRRYGCKAGVCPARENCKGNVKDAAFFEDFE